MKPLPGPQEVYDFMLGLTAQGMTIPDAATQALDEFSKEADVAQNVLRTCMGEQAFALFYKRAQSGWRTPGSLPANDPAASVKGSLLRSTRSVPGFGEVSYKDLTPNHLRRISQHYRSNAKEQNRQARIHALMADRVEEAKCQTLGQFCKTDGALRKFMDDIKKEVLT